MDLKKQLEWRWLVKDISSEKIYDIFENWGKVLYYGCDPTADSLHLWNLIGFMTGVNFMQAWNKLVLLVGGATWMVWDPGWKDSERSFLDIETLQKNVQAIEIQMWKILKNLERMSGKTFDYEVVNNYDFYKNMNVLDFWRNVWKYMTVNQMMAKETVKKRIEDSDKSISYTEFSYMLMQGYDFYRLFEDKNVILQAWGSDQWWNLITWVELIRKKTWEKTYAITRPLILAANWKKFWKSEGNAICLDEKKNSPYFVYQYFLNVSDEDVERYLKIFTLLPLEEIEKIKTQHFENPSARNGQEKLADYIIQMLFWDEALKNVKNLKQIFFWNENRLELVENFDIESLKREISSIKNEKDFLDSLIDLKFATSRWEAKKLLASKSIFVNENLVEDINHDLNDKFLKNWIILVRQWKKKFGLITK